VEQIKNNLKDDLKDKGIPRVESRGQRRPIVVEFTGAKERVDSLVTKNYPTLQELSASSKVASGRPCTSSTARKRSS